MYIKTNWKPDKFVYVEFDKDSTVDFIDSQTEVIVLSLQPTELKAIYASYRLMENENDMRFKETNPFLTSEPKVIYSNTGVTELTAPVSRYEFDLLKKEIKELKEQIIRQ